MGFSVRSGFDATERSLQSELLARGASGKEVARSVEGTEPHPHPGESVRPAFFAVHDTHRVADDEAGIPQHRHRFRQSAAGRSIKPSGAIQSACIVWLNRCSISLAWKADGSRTDWRRWTRPSWPSKS